MDASFREMSLTFFLVQVINSEAEDSDDVTDGEEDEEEEEETPIFGPFSTLTARPPIDIEELARFVH
jgi:hypothetical protein